MAQHFFAVVHLNKSKMIFFGIIGVIIIGLIVFLTGSLISSTGMSEGYTNLEFDIVVSDDQYEGELHAFFPRYFIAGGTSYDNSILEHHGIEASTSNNINHFEKVGIYTLKSEIQKMRYYPDDNKVEIIVSPKENGFNLTKFDKGLLEEGPITYEFLDSGGERILIEEDYIYSLPLRYVLIEEGEACASSASLDRFVIVDKEVKPVLASYGYDIDLTDQDDNKLTLFVFGGKVETVQKQGDNVRVYFNDSEGYQVISLDTKGLEEGQNFIKFIRENDLREIKTISFWKNN